MSNAEESGDVRKQLLDTQAELAEARADLELWTQNAGSADSDNHTKKLGKQNTKSMVDISGQGNSDDAPPDVTKLMQNLSQLSDQLAKDALADEGVLSYDCTTFLWHKKLSRIVEGSHKSPRPYRMARIAWPRPASERCRVFLY